MYKRMKKKSENKRPKRITISDTDKLNFISNLATMLKAGIPILTAIHSLGEDAHGNVKKILEQMYEDLMNGKKIYQSFAEYPHVFDEVTINMIKASEQAGTLSVVLSDLKDQIKKDIAFKRKMRSAITYPILVLIVFLAVLLLILIVVIPKITTVFTQLKVPLPLPTKILMFASNFLLHYTIYFLAGIGLLAVALFFLYRTQKKRIITFLGRIPLIATFIRYVDLLRFSRSLYLLMDSGITIINALELCEEIVVSKNVKMAVVSVKQTILAGKSFSYSLKQHKKIFPGTMIQLVNAGEQTGTLDDSMRDISVYLEYKVSDTLQMLTTLIEPVMLVVVALLVGGMMAAIIGPIYGLIGQIGPH
jgi:type II secretory pathway component PulF